MCKYLIDPNFWVSIIAIIISIIALFQSNKQAKISNKFNLFERRLEKYLTFKQLLTVYEKQKNSLSIKDGVIISPDFHATMLTNCVLLEEMANAFKKTINDPEKHKIFLTKNEQLQHIAMEISILWNNEDGKLASAFIDKFNELIFKLYQQRITILGVERRCEREGIPKTSTEIERFAQDNLLSETVEELRALYELILEKECENKLLMQMKVKNGRS